MRHQARSGSTFPVDPNGTAAWNAVVRGAKVTKEPAQPRPALPRAAPAPGGARGAVGCVPARRGPRRPEG